MGHTVNFRTKKLSYKDKNSVHNSPKDWIIFENTQEAIVDEETRITVQKIRETKHRPTKKGDINPLTGLVYCADCGAKMFNHRTGGYEKRDKDGNPTGKVHQCTGQLHLAPPTVRQRASLKTDAHSIMSARMLSGICFWKLLKLPALM